MVYGAGLDAPGGLRFGPDGFLITPTLPAVRDVRAN
jgi:hypothetical protein